jgi:uncharacterized protein (TIRG00374 family)
MKTILKTGVSLTLLIYVGLQLDWSAVWKSMSSLKWWTLPAAVFFQALAFSVGAIRWHTLLVAQGLPYRLAQLIPPYLIGAFFNNFLPASTGGDIFRIYHIQLRSHGIGAAFSPVFTERALGLVTLLLISLVASTFYEGDEPIVTKTVFAAALFFAGLVSFLFALGFSASYWPLHRWLERQSDNKLVKGLLAISESTHHFLARPALVLRIVLISGVMHLMMTTAFWTLGQGVSSELSPGYYFLTVPLILVSAAIPITLGGLGVREAAGIVLLTSVGMLPADAAAVAILFIPTLYLASFQGLFFLVIRKQGLSTRREDK